MRPRIILHLFIFVFGLFSFNISAETRAIKEISVLSINSAITPATLDYLRNNFSKISPESLILIKLNTPGGLVTTTKDIITLIGQHSGPIAVWITPEGATAASAGAILSAAAHFIFMSPGTNLGAATPISLGGDLKESDGRSKAINDLTALVRSLSHSRGRPSEPFEDMIKNAGSYTDKESLKLKIINGIFSNEAQIISYLNQQKIVLQGNQVDLAVEPTTAIKEYAPSLGQKILEVLTNPSLAYFLFLIGVALIYFEFQAPGGYIAGSVGVFFIIMAAIAFQVLPLDWGAFTLILVGVFLLILEIFVISYGLLSLAGLIGFVVGSLFLFHGDTGYISIQHSVIVSTLAGVLVPSAIIVWYLIKQEGLRPNVKDFFAPEKAFGVVLSKDGELYQVKVRGEIWRATSEDDLHIGDHIQVQDINQAHLTMTIKKQ